MKVLTPAIVSSVIAYLLTSACALLLVRRRFNNRRLRLLTMVIGMMPFLQAMTLLSDRGMRLFGLSNEIPDLIDLFVSMLCLWSIHLLDVESRDRQHMDVKMRLVESEAQKAAAKAKVVLPGSPA